MQTTSHNRIKIIFVLAAVVLLALSALSYRRITSLINTGDLVNHTQRVKLALERTFAELLQAETSQRGYIYTRDSSFRQEMTNSLRNVDYYLDQVDSLTSKTESLRENVAALRLATNKRMVYMEGSLTDAIHQELPVVRWMGGKLLMGEVRNQINDMQREQEELLRTETAKLNDAAFFTPLVSFVLIGFSLILLAAAYLRILAELRISDRLRFNLEQKQGELEQSNKELVHRNQETLSAITRIKQNEIALKQQTRQLEDNNQDLLRLNKELELFNYISSHDLQEPLRKIQIFASRIQKSEAGHLTEKGEDDMHRMQEAASRMQLLIEDLLAYSRMNTGEKTFVHADLRELTEEVRSGFQEELQQRAARIDINNMCTANVIPFQFRQMMQNLISNALKFSVANKNPQIRISGEWIDYETMKKRHNNFLAANNGQAGGKFTPASTFCHISVCDNGIGFDPQYSERIFEIFQRLHSNSSYEGTGMGLAIVKKIVDNHEGVITANSQPGEGACFDIYLPQQS